MQSRKLSIAAISLNCTFYSEFHKSLNALNGLHSCIFPKNGILSWHFFSLPIFSSYCYTVFRLVLFPTRNMPSLLSSFLKNEYFSLWLFIWCALVQFLLPHVSFMLVFIELLDLWAYSFHPIWKISAHCFLKYFLFALPPPCFSD